MEPLSISISNESLTQLEKHSNLISRKNQVKEVITGDDQSARPIDPQPFSDIAESQEIITTINNEIRDLHDSQKRIEELNARIEAGNKQLAGLKNMRAFILVSVLIVTAILLYFILKSPN